MPKIRVMGAAAPTDRNHVLDNIDIKGNGPGSIKVYVLIGLAVAAYFAMKSKTL